MPGWSRRATLLVLGLGAAGLRTPGLHAAGIDCGKARTPTEKAICATPGLLALDQQIAAAYADAIARQPDRRDAMRQDLLRWLKQRDGACALPSGDIPACLAGQMGERLAALAPPPKPQPAAAPPGLAQMAPPAVRPDDPPLPPDVTPPGAAAIDQASLAAAPNAETLLHVTSPGRFTIRAKSDSGAALQLVDIMTGPGEEAGVAGAQDGRIDTLLDTGTYKLRVRSAAAASGRVALGVTPFHDAAPPAALPPPGAPLAATLLDGEQRAFWLAVPPDGAVRIEAAGRSLADVRLWRDGRDLTALEPAALRVEPATGHPLTDLRLEGRVEPGTYLAVVYGGPALAWTDGDAAQPLLLRAGASPALAEGWAGGPMGPFGSEVYALPPGAGLLRLTLPAAAAAELRAGEEAALLTRTDRDPMARLAVSAKQTPVVEVRAAAGQEFTLQALEQPATRVVNRAGTYWVSAVVNGAGGDGVPPGVLLERIEAADKPPRIIASTVPQIGPGAAWHTRFNLRGPTTLLVQNTAGGELAVRSTGAGSTQRGRPGVYDLPADYYGLDIIPARGAEGSADLVVGPPGAAAPPVTAWPVDPVIPFGVQVVAPGQTLRLAGPSAPGVQVGLSARKVPVALAEGPLTATQAVGTSLAIPVALAPGGTLAVSEVGGGPVAFGLQAASGGSTVVVPIADHARSVVLAWRRVTAPAPIPAPAAPGAAAMVAPGRPAALDLAEGETRGYALDVPEGGLYRVETLGRLHTAGRIGTAFIPRLGEAEANGAGGNMLLQQILRAGRYRVDVTARESAGHLGLAVAPAPILTGAALTPGGSVRASVPAGAAISFPLEVAGPGDRYRLEAGSLGAPWEGRIEDAQGWPMARTGPLDGATPVLPPGAYRLVVAPPVVDRQVVARLSAVMAVPEITGHGPHPLPFETPQRATWREPAGRDQPRTPDEWVFALAGPAEVQLSLGDGMVGALQREGDAAPAARVIGVYKAALEPGRYRLSATSLGRNDRLGYTVGLTSPMLQPGVPRRVTLPATLGFAVAEARVVSLTSFGNVPVAGVLRRADGGVVTRVGARRDDWNIALSRLLPAGRYTLGLTAAAPPDIATVSRPGGYGAEQDDGSEAKPDDDDQAAQTPPSPAPPDSAPDTASASDDPAPVPTTELRLALPDALPVIPAPAEAMALTGAGVHALSLAQPVAGQLVVAQAVSRAPVTLALERQDEGGWRVIALDEGAAPAVASPADDAAAAWRVEAWAVDGGDTPIEVGVRAVAVPAQRAGRVSLAALDGMPAPLAVARVGLGGAGPVAVRGDGLFVGGWAGQALAPLNGPVLTQSGDVWLLGHAAGAAEVSVLTLAGTQALVVPPGQVAPLAPVTPAPGRVAIWRAEGAFGQPGLGAGAGVAQYGAVARADGPVVLRNASGEGSLRVALTLLDVSMLPGRTLDAGLQTMLPPGAALPLQMPAGDKDLQLELGAGVAAFAGGSAVWAGGAPVSRTLPGPWTDILLVNTNAAAAPAGVAWQPGPPAAPLQPGRVMKRFFGAAGSFEAAFDAPPGARIMVAGDATLTAIGADGAVARGRKVSAGGAGRVVVQHGAGPGAVWLAVEGVAAWPAAIAQPVQPPARLAMTGAAMALALDQTAPSLLHLSTTAPVLAALVQAGRSDPPRLYPAGAELHVMLAAGPAQLLLYSATDGPLTGSLALSADPVLLLAEGLGEEVIAGPGGTAAFGFSLAQAATIGVGVRADPDRATVRLLDASGAIRGEGLAQLRALPAGRYVIEAQVPLDAPPTVIRPAVIGITPRGAGPPPEVVEQYLELAGMKPQGPGP